MDDHGIEGEIVLTCDVTYFVRNIVPFIEKMQLAARRRVMILVWSEPPPNRGADLFRRVYGEPLAPMPGHRELLPVLWDMGHPPRRARAAGTDVVGNLAVRHAGGCDRVGDFWPLVPGRRARYGLPHF